VSAFATAGIRLRDLAGRRVVVWGEGREGKAAVDVVSRHAPPSELTIVIDEEPSPGSAALSAGSVHGRAAIASAEVIVKSPGVSPYHGAFAELTAGCTITGGTALWFAETNGRASVGITGSKGKSTTSALVAHLLTGLGERVVLAGNIGVAPIDVLGLELDRRLTPTALPAPARWVLELSSFQSAEVSASPEHGILTSLFPEHLDWHGSIDRYYGDKLNLFAHGSEHRCALAANVGNADIASTVLGRPSTSGFDVAGAVRAQGSRVLDCDGTELVDLADSRLLGTHNASNAAGALTLLRLLGNDLGARRDDLRALLSSFVPLAHRLEPVGEIGGRSIIDDSLSTAPQAAAAALAAFADRPVAIIVGGYDRGIDYLPLAQACARRAAPTWVLGVPQSGERLIPLIADAVRAAGSDHVRVEGFSGPDGFDDAVLQAERLTPVGGVILLSPGAPSFGRFADYRERGLHFRRLLGLGTS
jgi:UDP-N-acetylmuramoyl-L-alanine---L-glutamate ligase